ncbi:MAG: prolipoprotein diacylglyceryl transferase [Oscillospiraceae bacterium]|nr:prolipoprotein diacylglyceryl transferase [Oscillospiraceae bacterium]
MTDSPIRFPGLFGDWAFTLPSKAVDVGHGIYWYGILITLGLLIALVFCLRRRHWFGLSEDNVMDTVLWGIPCGIIGARLYYVIFYLDLYRNADGSIRWADTVAVWDGGLALYGVVIAVVIMMIVLSKVKKFKFFAMLDLVVMGLFIGQIVGRWGNFMNREAFGTLTSLPWRMQLTTVLGQQIEVHPTFLYESLWNLIGLILMVTVVAKNRRFDGENTWFYFLWYGVGRFFIEGLRTDSLYLFGWKLFGQPIRVSQALSLVMVAVALFMLLWNLKLHPHDPQELFVNQAAARKAAEEAAPEAAEAAPEAAPAQEAGTPAEEPEEKKEEDAQ